MKSAKSFKLITIAALMCLSFGAIVSSCSKDDSNPPPSTNKTALQQSVDSANWYLDNTVEGTKPGEYTVGSKAALTTARNSAKTILDNTASTQTELDNATANLNAAIGTYKSAYISEIAAANLVAFWKFNGNANDSSGNGHNGTITQGHAFFGAGTPTLTADRFGNADKAYHFDHGGNIEVPYAQSLNPQQMSISLWVRQETAGRTINPANCYMIAMNRWNGWKFQTQPSLPFFTVKAFNAPDTVYYDRDDAGTALVAGATWYHLIVTFKPGEENFYINGALIKSWTNVPGTPITVNPPINVTIGSDLPVDKYLTVDASGNFLVDYGGFWTGDMDDVMFYNIALTAPQAQSIYNNQNTQ